MSVFEVELTRNVLRPLRYPRFESLPFKRKAKFIRIEIGCTGGIESKCILFLT
jgi:hypothetical protein